MISPRVRDACSRAHPDRVATADVRFAELHARRGQHAESVKRALQSMAGCKQYTWARRGHLAAAEAIIVHAAVPPKYSPFNVSLEMRLVVAAQGVLDLVAVLANRNGPLIQNITKAFLSLRPAAAPGPAPPGAPARRIYRILMF